MDGFVVMLDSRLPGIASGQVPFEDRRLSDSYVYFYHMANRAGEQLLFASPYDFLGNGCIGGHWVPIGGKWKPVAERARIALLFDKLGGETSFLRSVIQQSLSLEIPIFADQGLGQFAGDKWSSYKAFCRHHAYTQLLSADPDEIESQLEGFCETLDRVYERHDNMAVLKPRWGRDGRGLFLLERSPAGYDLWRWVAGKTEPVSDLRGVIAELSGIPYIIQAFVNTRAGIPELDLQDACHNVRFVFSILRMGVAQFLQVYITTSDGVIYPELSAFPQSLLTALESVAEDMATRFSHGIFSIDFLRDSSGRWFLVEINDQIDFGIDFANPRDVHGVTKLMRRYLMELRGFTPRSRCKARVGRETG